MFFLRKVKDIFRYAPCAWRYVKMVGDIGVSASA
jgi:hypothetical protein